MEDEELTVRKLSLSYQVNYSVDIEMINVKKAQQKASTIGL